MSGLRVAVLGAGGTIAPGIVRDLAESDEVADLLLLDLDDERARAVARVHGLGRARVEAADARAGLAASLEGIDVLVNSAGYRSNVVSMRACLDARCHYLDLGGLYHVTGEQLALSDEFEAADLLAILGIGSSPGKTNLMAVRAARDLTGADSGPLDSVHVVAAGRDLDPPDGFSTPYSVRTLVDELTLPPVVVRNGRTEEVPPLSSGGEVRFPDPIGSAETIHTLHSELRTFPDSFSCREATFRLSLAPSLLARLRELAGASDADVAAATRTAIPPSARTVSAHLVEASAGGRTVRVTAFTRPIEHWGLGGGIVSTAAPAAASVRLLARGAVGARGALPPERCIDPDDMFGELERRGCTFEVEAVAEAVA